ncbi:MULTISPECIES: hypothetical protein [Haloarcula]|uniref:Uncharacterized protein n=1 Tax=Haloarcula pellucida TaxID=1427151 RepID=A0A830GFR7_9EURY|nr:MULTISPECIES: hypothetical protein [Halomicroarcula]MBX0346946.1 hypothetical protein [Halomicroarcula pellucida]MDS0277179.1 hypothetical protein [Halomicroarcula sp. S1AR25-4]GGN86212.1 hypothetical protein GCM10009030_03670 [Halomicroarcula pellucida]
MTETGTDDGTDVGDALSALGDSMERLSTNTTGLGDAVERLQASTQRLSAQQSAIAERMTETADTLGRDDTARQPSSRRSHGRSAVADD